MKNSRNRILRLYGPSLVMLLVLIPFFSNYLKQVKVEEGYQNDRAFRVLDLIARQFNDEIEGAHNTITAALLVPKQAETLWISPQPLPSPQESIRRYLDAYIGDKYIPDSDQLIPLVPPVGRQGEMKVREVEYGVSDADPPHSHAIVRFQDSRNFIELSHEEALASPSDKVRIRIFLDPAKMLERAVQNGRTGLFDTVFVGSLLDRGEVLAQKSNPPVNVLLVDSVLRSVRMHGSIETLSSAKAADDSKSTAGDLARDASGANQRFDVRVAGDSYVLFTVPAPFALDDRRPADTQESKASSAMRVAFYGLVRKDSLEKQALSLPDVAVSGILLTLFAGFAFLWPPLKLFTMSDRERLRKSSVVSIFASALLAAVAIAALALSWGLWRGLSEEEDNHLKELASDVRVHLVAELHAGFKTADTVKSLFPRDDPKRLSFEDLMSFNDAAAQKLNASYPFFKHLIVSEPLPGEPDGQRQTFKLSANTIPTPFVNLPVARYPFLSRLNLNPSKLGDQQFVLQSFISPNTGEFLPIVVFIPKADKASGIGESMRITLTTELPSLVNVIFPRGFGFALIEPDGTVDFHSEPSRNLKENFFSECKDSSELRRYIRLGEKEPLNLHYGGEAVRAFVQPLGDPAENLSLSLIVYSRFSEQENHITSVGMHFASVMAVMLLLFAGTAALKGPLRWTQLYANTIAYFKARIWPREADKPIYALEGIWCLACFVAAIGSAVLLSPLDSLCVLSLLIILCVGGLCLALQRMFLLRNLIAHDRFKRWLESLPLSSAYSLRTLGLALGLVGVASILVFQCCLYVAEAEKREEDNAYVSAKLKARSERIIAALHARAKEKNLDELCKESRPDYDLYEFGKQRPISIPPIPTCALPLQESLTPTTAKWRSLPGLNCWGNFFEFYLPVLFLFGGIFIWLHAIIRRLFLLDFREPEMLPRINKDELAQRIRTGGDSKAKTFARLLVFAHPHAGTSVAIAEIMANFKSDSQPVENVIADFSQLDASGAWTQPDFRERVVKAAQTNKLIIFDNFEVRLTETENRSAKLTLLEAVVYDHHAGVYLITSSDPLLLAQSLLNEDSENVALRAEVDRWTRVLSNFECVAFVSDSTSFEITRAINAWLLNLNLDLWPRKTEREEMRAMLEEELIPTVFRGYRAADIDLCRFLVSRPRDFESSLISFVRLHADGYYSGLWLNCTSGERLALYQLAKDNWLNPLNRVAISHLWRKRLIVKTCVQPGGSGPQTGAYRLMNASFRAFVLDAVSQHELALWKAQQTLSAWPSLRMALGTSTIMLAGFLFYVAPDRFNAYFGYLAILAGGGTAVVRIIVQFFSKANPTLADLVGGSAAKSGSNSA